MVMKPRGLSWIRLVVLCGAIGAPLVAGGCGGGAKDDGVIEPAPEATSAAEAISKQYSQDYAKQYGTKGAAK